MSEQVLEKEANNTLPQDTAVDLKTAFRESHVQEILDRLDIDRARLRQANRLLSSGKNLTKQDLITIEAADILASRVFREGVPDCDPEG
jgi:AAA lid domain